MRSSPGQVFVLWQAVVAADPKVMDPFKAHRFYRAPQGPSRREALVQVLLHQDIDGLTSATEELAVASASPNDKSPLAHVCGFLLWS